MSRIFGCVIVNYNTTRMSLEAAQSFLEDGGDNVVIVDNASTEEEFARFRELELPVAKCSFSSDKKDVSPFEERVFLSAKDVLIASAEAPPPRCAKVTVLSSTQNRGFAGACNIGLRFLRRTAHPTHYLLLNPDARIARGALDAFALALESPDVGLCGATVVEYDPPHSIQALGGARISRLLHAGANVAEGNPFECHASHKETNQIDYPHGAAMALKSSYIDLAGYLDERYFLYFEEADWARSGSPLRVEWAPDAVVYHRYGASSGSKKTKPGEPSARSVLSDMHMARSRMLFALKWRPLTIPFVFAATLVQAIGRIARGRHANALGLLQGLVSVGFRKRHEAPKRHSRLSA